MTHYSMLIQWSEEDQLFLVTIPEFSDNVIMPCTHGQTREEAIHNGEEVIEMYLEAWETESETIPQPRIFIQHKSQPRIPGQYAGKLTIPEDFNEP